MDNPIRLLVIESDLSNQKVIQNALTNSFLDATVYYSSTIKETEQIFSEKDWNLILADYHLGTEVLKHLFDEKKVDIPIIFMSTTLNESILNDILKYEDSDFLTKSLITSERIGLSVRNAIIGSEKQKAHEGNLVNAKLKAEKLVKLKQGFLANMSHEIRTPMNAIIGFTDIVLGNELKPEVRDKIERIKQSGENLLVIINDILDFTKIEKGKLGVENISFSLEKVIDNVKAQLENIAQAKKVRLVVNRDSEVPENIKGDPVRLSQILMNLMDNAIKFTENGFVELRVKIVSIQNGDTIIQFEIEDTGIGIPTSKQESIFDSFTQASSTTTRKFGGSGLGLSICKQLVHLLGGEIWLNSQENVGSTFFFTISTESVQEELDNPTTNIEEFNISGTKVLLVEDNVMNRELAIHFLKEWGVEYDTAKNGDLGVSKVKHNNYDLILMDLSMPVMDGYQAANKIRLLEDDKARIPILAMTANAFKNDIDKCFEVGMNDHISKPFKSEELKIKIYQLVNKVESTLSKSKDKLDQLKELKDEKLFCLDLLKDMGGDNSDFTKEMVEIYVTQSPLTLKRLLKALDAWETAEIKAAAHKLRSPAALMGISKAVELTEFIEVNVFDNGKRDQVKLAVERLNELINKVISQVKELYL